MPEHRKKILTATAAAAPIFSITHRGLSSQCCRSFRKKVPTGLQRPRLQALRFVTVEACDRNFVTVEPAVADLQTTM